MTESRITPCGLICGVPAQAKGVTAYKGIRYATAERWRYPVPVTHWDGVYHAEKYGPCAMQQSAFMSEKDSGRDPFYYHEFREGLDYTYSEDCLFLNIWAPDNAQRAPVIVYIHGGAFLGGSSWDKAFDEPLWTQQGAIAVTINYRLGPLGYACLPELASEAGHTGNYGLYDQLCALQWIHTNIEAFGGDPNNITLMGQSAGARSVQILCSSTASENLIHRAVMSSGGGEPSVLFTGDRWMESKYPFWQDWKSEVGAQTLKELRSLPVERLFGALGNCFKTCGFAAVMENMGPVWDNALFIEGMPTLKIPYLAGGNSEDMRPELAMDGLRWCQKQPVASYAYYFCRHLPGDDKGAWHSADLWYWFGSLENSWRPFTPEDRDLSDMMISYLVNFARTGNPNAPGLPVWENAGQSGCMLRLDLHNLLMESKVAGKSGVFGW